MYDVGDRDGRHFLSLDEVSRLHEQWGRFVDEPSSWMRTVDVFGGAFRNLWVIAAALLVVGVGLVYLPFLAHLGRPTRVGFAIAGMVFVFVTVGFEMIEASYTAHGGRRLLGFAVLVTIEEVLEMASITFFLYAVLRHVADAFGSSQVAYR